MATKTGMPENEAVPTESLEQANPEVAGTAYERVMERAATARAIAVFDALGFSDAIATQPIDLVLKRYGELIVLSYATRGQEVRIMRDFMVFSDTVVCYPPDDVEPKDFFVRLVQYLRTLISNVILMNYDQYTFPIRAGVSVGEFIAEPELQLPVAEHVTRRFHVPSQCPVLVGEAVVRSYQWERTQKWVGASIDPTSWHDLRVQHPDWLAEPLGGNDLVEWHVPTSRGLVTTLAVNFVDEGRAYDALSCLLRYERGAEEPGVKAKYTGSRLFAQSMIETKRFNSVRAKPADAGTRPQ